MNDAMTRNEDIAQYTRDIFAAVDLPNAIVECLKDGITRGNLVVDIVRREFGRFNTSQIKRAIGDLIKAERISTGSGKTRINDREVLSRVSDLL